jgi:hypothetical protein
MTHNLRVITYDSSNKRFFLTYKPKLLATFITYYAIVQAPLFFKRVVVNNLAKIGVFIGRLMQYLA